MRCGRQLVCRELQEGIHEMDGNGNDDCAAFLIYGKGGPQGVRLPEEPSVQRLNFGSGGLRLVLVSRPLSSEKSFDIGMRIIPTTYCMLATVSCQLMALSGGRHLLDEQEIILKLLHSDNSTP